MRIHRIVVSLFLLVFAIGSYCLTLTKNINIVFIGDSITQGGSASTAPPVYTVSYLEAQKKWGSIKYANRGVSGATTLDFLPSTGKRFPAVETAATDFYTDKQSTLIFSIMLGTNDSAIEGPLGSPVSSADYGNNMKSIIDYLLSHFASCKVIIHYPIWYSPNTYNRSRYLQEGLTRLQSYSPVIDKLIKDYSKTNPLQVFAGDKLAFRYFKNHHLTHMKHENGQQGVFYLHPNEIGSTELGRFWGKAISKIISRN